MSRKLKQKRGKSAQSEWLQPMADEIIIQIIPDKDRVSWSDSHLSNSHRKSEYLS